MNFIAILGLLHAYIGWRLVPDLGAGPLRIAGAGRRDRILCDDAARHPGSWPAATTAGGAARGSRPVHGWILVLVARLHFVARSAVARGRADLVAGARIYTAFGYRHVRCSARCHCDGSWICGCAASGAHRQRGCPDPEPAGRAAWIFHRADQRRARRPRDSQGIRRCHRGCGERPAPGSHRGDRRHRRRSCRRARQSHGSVGQTHFASRHFSGDRQSRVLLRERVRGSRSSGVSV